MAQTIEEIKQQLRQRVMTTYNGVGLPPVDCICIFEQTGQDVRIIAHTFVAGKVSAVWQYGFDFGYGREGDFSIDPDQEIAP